MRCLCVWHHWSLAIRSRRRKPYPEPIGWASPTTPTYLAEALDVVARCTIDGEGVMRNRLAGDSILRRGDVARGRRAHFVRASRSS